MTLRPLPCSTTSATTSASATVGLPTVTLSPSETRRTSRSSTRLPGAASSVATSSTLPACTRYCLPPLRITASITDLPKGQTNLSVCAPQCQFGTECRVQSARGICPYALCPNDLCPHFAGATARRGGGRASTGSPGPKTSRPPAP